jgi:hypothetical protein
MENLFYVKNFHQLVFATEKPTDKTDGEWYQNRWFNEGFDRLLVSKVFPTKVVRRQVPLSTTTVVQVYG